MWQEQANPHSNKNYQYSYQAYACQEGENNYPSNDSDNEVIMIEPDHSSVPQSIYNQMPPPLQNMEQHLQPQNHLLPIQSVSEQAYLSSSMNGHLNKEDSAVQLMHGAPVMPDVIDINDIDQVYSSRYSSSDQRAKDYNTSVSVNETNSQEFPQNNGSNINGKRQPPLGYSSNSTTDTTAASVASYIQEGEKRGVLETTPPSNGVVTSENIEMNEDSPVDFSYMNFKMAMDVGGVLPNCFVFRISGERTHGTLDLPNNYTTFQNKFLTNNVCISKTNYN